jgi:recombination protein RecT
MSNIQNQNNKPTKIEALKSILKAPSVQEQFQNVLKENAGAFVASIIDLYNGDNYLQQCEPKEVVMEALKAAVLKLPINKSLGFAYIIPYNNNVKGQDGTWQKKVQPQFQIGYKGLIQMAMRTGQYRFINADMVYEGELRDANKLTGEIDFSGQKKNENIVGYFAYIELLNGFSKTLYMTKERVLSHAKKYSKSFEGKNSPWTNHFDEMALKTVLKNLLGHYGFLSVEMMAAFDNDEQPDYSGNNGANTKEIGIEEAEVIQSDPQQEEEPVVTGPDF